MEGFDPDGVAVDNGNYFGMPFSCEQSKVVLISAPWDVTVSYGAGTSNAPESIIKASTQLDFYDQDNPEGWKCGIATAPIDNLIYEKNQQARANACRVIDALSSGVPLGDESIKEDTQVVNQASCWFNENIYQQAKGWLSEQKIVGLVGGDHSSPFGLIRALSEKYDNLGVLHVDAHLDLREAYEGFEYSHASIMYNVSTRMPSVKSFVQVGVRDFSKGEYMYASGDKRFSVWTDKLLSESKFEGESWKQLTEKIISTLPQDVYVSFDIDGLDSSLCPGTGTPVAGGLSYNEACYLLLSVVKSGRRIVGFDVCEVAPTFNAEGEDTQWDANVGARILYKLCNLVTRK